MSALLSKTKLWKDGAMLSFNNGSVVLLSAYAAFLVGGHGADALAVYGLGSAVLLLAGFCLTGFAPTVMSSLASAKGDPDKLRGAAARVMAASLVTAVLLALLFAIVAKTLGGILFESPEHRSLLDRYILAALMGIPVSGFGVVVSALCVRAGLVHVLLRRTALSVTAQAMLTSSISAATADASILLVAIPIVSTSATLVVAAANLKTLPDLGWTIWRDVPMAFDRATWRIAVDGVTNGADAVSIAALFAAIAVIATGIDPVAAAITASAVFLLRSVILPVKAFGLVTGRYVASAIASGDNSALTANANTGLKVVATLTSVAAGGLVALSGMLPSWFLPGLTAAQAEAFTFVLVMAAIQVFAEPLASFLATLLKSMRMGRTVLGATFAYQWMFVVPAGFAVAAVSNSPLHHLWVCLVVGRLGFAVVITSAWLRATRPARPAEAAT